jgi:SAM-dependent methyltransferase
VNDREVTVDAVVNVAQAEAWNGWEGENWARNSERYDAMMREFDEVFFRAAGLAAQDHVLDVGCGTGQTARRAARTAARVVGIDISGPMLARARQLTHEANLTFVHGDAQAHPFPDGGFDTAISRGGTMFFTDPVAAFANIARALRPRGRLTFLGPQASRPDGAYSRATAALTPWLREPSPAARGMASLTDPAAIRRLLDATGFTDVVVEPVDRPMSYGADASEAADFVLSQGPVRHNLRDATDAEIDHVRTGLRDGFEPFRTPDGVLVPGHVWLVTATRG